MTENNNNGNIEVFTAEFRHEVVRRFIEELSYGIIELPWPSDLNSEAFKNAAETYVSLKKDIEEYVSGKLSQQKLNDIESHIFSKIISLRISGMTTHPSKTMNNEIEQLNKKIDSTNKLLLRVLVILNEVLKQFDK